MKTNQNEPHLISGTNEFDHVNATIQSSVNAGRTSTCPQPLYLEKDKFVLITGARLPHWHQDGKVQFVTFRLADSLPQEKLQELTAIKSEWMKGHPQPWDSKTEEEYNLLVGNKVDTWLNSGYGKCILRLPAIRQIVEDALRFFDGVRYVLYAYVIMPNHVHALLSPINGFHVTDLMGSIKRHSASVINQSLGRQGSVWQRQVFDHMVRDATEFSQHVRYIQNNPKGLPAGSFSLGGDVFNVAEKT